VLGLVGLAARSRNCVAGTAQVRDAARGGRVALVLIATDASTNARGKLIPLLGATGIESIERFDRVTLGAAAGRAPLSAIGITDASMATRIRALLKTGDTPGPARAPEQKTG
jgi:ribosomal protein L7Ae-like RNA K-turn-binding protein